MTNDVDMGLGQKYRSYRSYSHTQIDYNFAWGTWCSKPWDFLGGSKLRQPIGWCPSWFRCLTSGPPRPGPGWFPLARFICRFLESIYLKEMHKESRGLRGREFLLLLSVQKLLRWMASCWNISSWGALTFSRTITVPACLWISNSTAWGNIGILETASKGPHLAGIAPGWVQKKLCSYKRRKEVEA